MRTSTPRSRNTRSAERDNRGCSSGNTRGAVSSSIQRIRWSRNAGWALASWAVNRAPCAATSVPV